MRVDIRDREALLGVSPGALSAYARASGWIKAERYGDHSDVYAAAELPEIILPRHQRLADYASVVWQLIEVFAKAAETDELVLYRDLVTADRDVLRVRAPDGEAGSVNVSDGVTLMHGARDMLLSAACSLSSPQPLYRAGANKEASEYLKQVRMGQTEQGSFVITLLSPVVPPRMQLGLSSDWAQDDDPIERRITRRLVGALTAVREATEITIAGDADAFFRAIEHGVSANLCEALVSVMEPFREIDVTVTWARTRPAPQARDIVRFAASDAPILREAARSFRSREPQPDQTLVGFVRMLKRSKEERDGTVTLLTSIDGRNQSVTTVLKQADYERAVSAHGERASVVVKGDLEGVGQRWSLLNPMIVDVIRNVDASGDSES